MMTITKYSLQNIASNIYMQLATIALVIKHGQLDLFTLYNNHAGTFTL